LTTLPAPIHCHWSDQAHIWQHTQVPDFPSVSYPSALSLFTTFRWPLSETLLQAHLCRLADHCQCCQWTVPSGFIDWQVPSASNWLGSQLSGIHSAKIRIGIAQRTMGLSSINQPAHQVTATFAWLSMLPLSDIPKQAVTLQTVRYEKAFPHLKHTGLIEPLLLRQKAQQSGFDDALWVNHQGFITEATTANVFFVRVDGTLVTPHLVKAGCLSGIQRRQVMAVCETLGRPVCETLITPEQINDFVGGLTTNAVAGCTKIGQINDWIVPWPNEAQQVYEQLQHALRTFNVTI